MDVHGNYVRLMTAQNLERFLSITSGGDNRDVRIRVENVNQELSYYRRIFHY
jgi:hypothetical protein